MPAWKAFAALVDTSLPNRASDREKCRLAFFCKVGRSMTPAFLDIDLEQIAQVVERRRGLAEETLLLDRRRLGVTLDHNQAAQHSAVFARDLLPRLFAFMSSEGNFPVLDLRREQHAPLIFG